jgi:hypothetical protein
LPQLDLSAVGERAQFGFVGEFVGRPRAVEQSDRTMRNGERVAQHRPQRRDAGAAGDEDEARLGGIGRKRERAERPFDVDQHAGFEGQMRPGGSGGVDADEQLDRSGLLRVFGRRRNRIRPPFAVAVSGDEHRLTGGVLERQRIQIDAEDSRARRRGQHVADG